MVQQYDLRNEIVSFCHEMEEPTVTHNINYMKGERKGIVVRKAISTRSIQNTQGRREVKNAVLLILPTV
jgi:hypothetical protein